jgi:hypothetical protein
MIGGPSPARWDSSVAPAPTGERAWIAPLIAGVVALAVGVSLIDAVPIGGLFDDAAYVILAKSLATGQGFRWLNLPGAPLATHFPPGYPAVLAALWAIDPRFPANVLLFKVANAVFLALAAGGTVVLARRRLGFSTGAALAVTLAGALAIPTLELSTQVLSEALFLALLLPALLVAERTVEADAKLADVALLALMVGILTLVRTQGIALAGAVGLLLLARRRLRDAAVFAGVGLAVILPWQLWARAHPFAPSAVMGGDYAPYVAWLATGFHDGGISFAWATIARNGRQISDMLALYTARSTPPWVQGSACAALILLAVLGFVRFWRRARVTAVFLVLSFAIILVWPGPATHYVRGVWPFVVLLVAAGVAEVVATRPVSVVPRAARWATIAGAVLLATGYVSVNALGYRYRVWSAIPSMNAAALRPVIRWARERTSPTTVIAANLEPAIYLYANRLAVPSTASTVQEFFQPATAAQRADQLRAIMATYHVDAVASFAADSLRAAVESMSRGNDPGLVAGDSVSNGRIYSPAHR